MWHKLYESMFPPWLVKMVPAGWGLMVCWIFPLHTLSTLVLTALFECHRLHAYCC